TSPTTSSQNLLGIPNDHAAVAPAATSDPDPSSGFHTSTRSPHRANNEPNPPGRNQRLGPQTSGHPSRLAAGHALLTAHAGEHSKEEEAMQRRNVLRTLTALAAATTLPLAAWEAAQHHTDRLTDA